MARLLIALLTGFSAPALAGDMPEWVTGDPRPEWWTLQVEVRHDRADTDPDALLKSLGVVDLGPAKRGEKPEHTVTWHRFQGETLRPVTAEVLGDRGVGLTPPDQAMLIGATVGDILVFRFDRATAQPADFKAAHTLVDRYLDTVGGGAHDLMSRQIYAAAGWKKHRIEEGWKGDIPEITRHMQVHAYVDPKDQLGRVVTVGLIAFGLPEIEIDDCVPPAFTPLGITANLVATGLVADPSLPADRMLRVALPDGRVLKTRAEAAAPQEGDDGDWLISLQFREREGATPVDRHKAWMRAVMPPGPARTGP